MEIKILSSMSKVFDTQIANEYSISELTMLKNERTSFVVCVLSDLDSTLTLKIETDISHKIYFEKSVPVVLAAPEKHDDYFLNDCKPGEYPDCLIETNKCESKKDKYVAFRVELDTKNVESGTHPLKVTVSQTMTADSSWILDGKINLKVNVCNFALKEQTLKYTSWFHSDCLATHYKVDVFSEKYWLIVENYMRIARENGMNMILTPLFTPPLDTAVGKERPTVQLVDVRVDKKGRYKFNFDKLKRWIDLAHGVGIQYFEMSHLFSQWGAKYTPKIVAEVFDKKENRYVTKKIFGWSVKSKSKRYVEFLSAFAPCLKKKLRQWDIEENVYFHTSDEPSKKDFFTYKRNALLMQKLFGEYKMIDALSESRYYKKGLVKIPVPSIEHIQNFTENNDELWTYYCCGPAHNCLPNRFIAMPLLRVRILGLIMYVYDCKGFLHWGFDFWYTQLSKKEIDPYVSTDAGGKFPAGDAFVVYPNDDYTANPSIRLKVFYDCIEDYEACKCLEQKKGRDYVLSLINENLDAPLSETDYPHSEKYLTQTREKINTELGK